jgi:hypothetical protein
MQTEYAVGGFSVKKDGDSFRVFCADKELDSFNDFKQAVGLVQDLHLSKRATKNDDLIGTQRFCSSMFGNGHRVTVIAKVEDGYIVQFAGTNDRLTIEERYLDPMPNLFDLEAISKVKAAEFGDDPQDALANVIRDLRKMKKFKEADELAQKAQATTSYEEMLELVNQYAELAELNAPEQMGEDYDDIANLDEMTGLFQASNKSEEE